jgi:hypothetical protein
MKTKTIKGFEDYTITCDGIITNKNTKHVLKHVKNFHGYLQVGLYKDGKQKIKKVHILLAQHFLDNTRNYPVVRHLNDVKTDNRLENLSWGTHKDNTADMFRNGTDKVSRRFSKEEIIEIYTTNKPTKFFVEKYKVSRQAINSIRRDENYSHWTKDLQAPFRQESRIKASLEDKLAIVASDEPYSVLAKRYGLAISTICMYKKKYSKEIIE